MKPIRLLLKILLPLTILVISVGIAHHTIANRPEPERRTRPAEVPEVEAIAAKRSAYQVIARTRGTVAPRTEGTLVPEVSGRIVAVSPSLREGEFFEAGEVLLTLDPRDYQAEVEISEASLVQARMSLREEQARGDQAAREWKRLGESGAPDALVLRKPQLASVGAGVRGAEARLERARLNLERTSIVAPYAGRVLEQNVDIGQYVATGTVLARVYAVDYVEVRLPLTNRQLEYVDVPEIYRREPAEARQPGPVVRLRSSVGSREHVWEGRVVRAEGSFDTRSRQLFVIAQVEDPYRRSVEGRPPLKVGAFVTAEIEGRTLPDVFVIPRGTLRAGAAVLVLDDASRIQARDVAVIWSDERNAVVTEGIEEGERIVTSPVGLGMRGVEVRVAGRAPVEDRPADAAGRAP